MRADLAPAGLHLLLVVLGLTILDAAGLVRRSVRGVLAGAGLAYMTGLAALGLTLVVMLVAGVPFTLPTILAVLLLEIAAGALAAWRLRGLPALRPIRRPRVARFRASPDGIAVAAFAVVLATLGVLGALKAGVTPLADWDGWSIWARKGILLTGQDHLPLDFFGSSASAPFHPDYPLLIPVFEAAQFRFMGTIDTQAVHVGFWVLYVAFLWGAAFVASRLTRAVVWAPLLAAAAVAPGFLSQIFTAYGDVPVALFLGLGVLVLGWWLVEQRPPMLLLAVLLLAGAANVKNEGLMGAVAALAAAAVVVGTRPARGRQLVQLGMAAAATVALILPWRIWLSAHDIHGDLAIGNGLSPSYLGDRTSRVRPAVDAIYAQLIDQGRWLYLLPVALALVVACLVTRTAARVGSFYLLTGVFTTFGLVWSYWISGNEIHWYLSTSVDRVVTSVIAVSLAGALHMSGAVLGGPGAPLSPTTEASAPVRPRDEVASPAGAPVA